MRVVLQRVRDASVEVEGKIVGQIGKGMVLLLGATIGDSEKEVVYLADKCANLRIFEDAQGKMNLSVQEIGGEILVISQFTLYGDTRKGRRPSFTEAMEPKEAERLYLMFIDYLKEKGLRVEQGVFGAKMLVKIFNDGPVTFILDSKEK
ncbi:MAG: D-tyrosyl-tRNA(Tyr) deacylase [candidate division Zixibacteria bacterium RBG_16_43_9]|nr:MAG: D-tyrosyl-tRNA(Tyr) deacylase [candidate division Zixibacteria bacterium RBG_16_43_9]